MSILIKGMGMPAIEFEWTIRHGADGKWYAIDTNAETSDGKWHEIVPVPPHGDLIDRDKMFAAFVDEGQKSKRYKIGERWELNGKEIRNVIANLPDVIPAEPQKEEE